MLSDFAWTHLFHAKIPMGKAQPLHEVAEGLGSQRNAARKK